VYGNSIHVDYCVVKGEEGLFRSVVREMAGDERLALRGRREGQQARDKHCQFPISPAITLQARGQSKMLMLPLKKVHDGREAGRDCSVIEFVLSLGPIPSLQGYGHCG